VFQSFSIHIHVITGVVYSIRGRSDLFAKTSLYPLDRNETLIFSTRSFHGLESSTLRGKFFWSVWCPGKSAEYQERGNKTNGARSIVQCLHCYRQSEFPGEARILRGDFAVNRADSSMDLLPGSEAVVRFCSRVA
jgi:hypothetical protein